MAAHGVDFRLAGLLKGRFNEPGKFGRMFPHLRSLKPAQLAVSPEVLGAALLKDGALFDPGPTAPPQLPAGVTLGPMNGGQDPADTTQDNPRIRAGLTYFGQFLDHDVTFDPTSSLEQQNDPNSTRNFRTPMLELDSLYGAGPGAQPYMYNRGAFRLAARRDPGNPAAPLVECDVPRTGDAPTQQSAADLHTAIIGDPRNDENLIVNQIHFAMMKFHNAVLAGPANGDFEEAQRIVRWHYQWIIVHEYLPAICGKALVQDVLANGPRFYRIQDEPYMPVEFAVAAFRFGHSQVRSGYLVRAPFGMPLFGPDQLQQQPPNFPAGQPFSLRGSRIVPPALSLDFAQFFGPAAQRSKLIDRRLSTPLLLLPPTVVGPAPILRRSLATRNLQRGFTFALPSGQTVAKFMGDPVLDDAELWSGVPGGRGEAPLWFYMLREAEARNRGEHLAGIGARIVAEVFVGMLQGDKASYLNQWPDWRPTLASQGKSTLSYAERPEEQTIFVSDGERAGASFTLVDLLRFAGVMT